MWNAIAVRYVISPAPPEVSFLQKLDLNHVCWCGCEPGAS